MTYKHNIYNETKNTNKALLRSPLNSHWLDLKYGYQKWWYLIFLLSFFVFPRSKFGFINNQFNINLFQKVKEEYSRQFPFNKFSSLRARNKQTKRLSKRLSKLTEKVKYKNQIIQQPVEVLPILPNWKTNFNIRENSDLQYSQSYRFNPGLDNNSADRINYASFTSNDAKKLYYPLKTKVANLKYSDSQTNYNTGIILDTLEVFKKIDVDLDNILNNKVEYLLYNSVKPKLKSKKIYRQIRNNSQNLTLKKQKNQIRLHTYNLFSNFIEDTSIDKALNLFKRDLIRGHNINMSQINERMRLDNIKVRDLRPFEKLLVWDQSDTTIIHKEKFIAKLIYQLELCSQILNSRINLQHGVQKELVGKSLEHIDTAATGFALNSNTSAFSEQANHINQLIILLTNNLLLKRHALWYTGYVRTQIKRLNDEEAAEEQAELDKKAGKKPAKKKEGEEEPTLLTEEERKKIRKIRKANNNEMKKVFKLRLKKAETPSGKETRKARISAKNVRKVAKRADVKWHKYLSLMKKYQKAQTRQYDDEDVSIDGLDAFEENIDELIPKDCKVMDGYTDSIRIILDQLVDGILPLVDLDKIGEAQSNAYLHPDVIANNDIKLLDIIKSNITLLQNLQKYLPKNPNLNPTNKNLTKNTSLIPNFTLLDEERILHHPIDNYHLLDKILESFKTISGLIDETQVIIKDVHPTESSEVANQPKTRYTRRYLNRKKSRKDNLITPAPLKILSKIVDIEKYFGPNKKDSSAGIIKENPLSKNVKTIDTSIKPKEPSLLEIIFKNTAESALKNIESQELNNNSAEDYSKLNAKEIDRLLHLSTDKPEEEIENVLSKIKETKKYIRRIYKKTRLEYKDAINEIKTRYRREKKQEALELKKRIRKVKKTLDAFEKQPDSPEKLEVKTETYNSLKRQLNQLIAQQKVANGLDPDGNRPLDIENDKVAREVLGLDKITDKERDERETNANGEGTEEPKKTFDIKSITPRQLRRIEKRKRKIRKAMIYLAWIRSHTEDFENLKFLRQQERFAAMYFKYFVKQRTSKKVKAKGKKRMKRQLLKDFETFKIYKRTQHKLKEYLLSHLNSIYCDEKFIQLIKQADNNQKLWGFQNLYEIFRDMQLRNEFYNIAKIQNVNVNGPLNSRVTIDTNTDAFEVDDDEEEEVDKLLAQEIGIDYEEYEKLEDEEELEDEDDTSLLDTIDHGGLISEEIRYPMYKSEIEPRFLHDEKLAKKMSFFSPIYDLDKEQIAQEKALNDDEINKRQTTVKINNTPLMQQTLDKEKDKYINFRSTPLLADDENAKEYYPAPAFSETLNDSGNFEMFEEILEAPQTKEDAPAFEMATDVDQRLEPLKKSEVSDDDDDENAFYVTTIDFKEKDGNSNKYYTNKATSWINHRVEKTFSRLQQNVSNVKFILEARKQMLLHTHINTILSPGLNSYNVYELLTKNSNITTHNFHANNHKSLSHVRLRGSKELNFSSLGNIPLERNLIQKITQDYNVNESAQSDVAANHIKDKPLNLSNVDSTQLSSQKQSINGLPPKYEKVCTLFKMFNKARVFKKIVDKRFYKTIRPFWKAAWMADIESDKKQLEIETQYWEQFLKYAAGDDVRRSNFFSWLTSSSSDFIEGTDDLKNLINSLERSGHISFRVSPDQHTDDLIWSAFISFYHLNKGLDLELYEKMIRDAESFQSLYNINENTVFSVSTYQDKLPVLSRRNLETSERRRILSNELAFNDLRRRVLSDGGRDLLYLPFQSASSTEWKEFATKLNFMIDLSLGDLPFETQYGFRFRHLPPEYKFSTLFTGLYYKAIMNICAPTVGHSFIESNYFETIEDIEDELNEIETEKAYILRSFKTLSQSYPHMIFKPYFYERPIPPLIYHGYKNFKKFLKSLDRVPQTKKYWKEDQINEILYKDEIALMNVVNNEYLNPLNATIRYQPDYLHPNYEHRFQNATLFDTEPPETQSKNFHNNLKYKFINLPKLSGKPYKRIFRRINKIQNLEEGYRQDEHFPLAIGSDLLKYGRNLLKSPFFTNSLNTANLRLVQDKFLTNLQLQTLKTQHYVELFSTLQKSNVEKKNSLFANGYKNRLALRLESYFPNETYDDLIQMATSLNDSLRKENRQSQIQNKILITDPKLLELTKMFNIFSKTGFRKIGRRQLKRNTFFKNDYKSLNIQDAAMFANICDWSNWYLDKITNSKREALLNTRAFETNSLRRNEFLADFIDPQSPSKRLKLDESKLKDYDWPAFEDSTAYTPYNSSNKLTSKDKRYIKRKLLKFLKQFEKISNEIIDVYSTNAKIDFNSERRAKYDIVKDNRDSIESQLPPLQDLVYDFENRDLLHTLELSPDTISRNFSYLFENQDDDPMDLYAPDILPYRVYLRLMLENLENFQIPKSPEYNPNFGGPAVETSHAPIIPTRFNTRTRSLPGIWGEPYESRRNKYIIDDKEESEWYPFSDDGLDTVEKGRLDRLKPFYYCPYFLNEYLRELFFEPIVSFDFEEDSETAEPETLNEFTRNIKIDISSSKDQVNKFNNLPVLPKKEVLKHNHEISAIETSKGRNARGVSFERPQFGKSDRFIWPGPFSNSHDQLIILSIVFGFIGYYISLLFALLIVKFPGQQQVQGFIRDERRLRVLSQKYYSINLITNFQIQKILSDWILKRSEFLNYNITRTPDTTPLYWGEMHGILDHVLTYRPNIYHHRTFIDFTYNPLFWVTSSFSSEHFTVSSLGSPRYAQAWVQAMFTTENITNIHVELYKFIRSNVEKRKEFLHFEDGSIALEIKPWSEGAIKRQQGQNKAQLSLPKIPFLQTGKGARKARARKSRAIKRKLFFPERTFERLIYIAREYVPCFIVLDGFDRAVLSQKTFNVWNKEESYGYWPGGIYGSFGKITYNNAKTIKLQETIIRYLCYVAETLTQNSLYKFCLTVPDSTRLDYRLGLPKRFYFRYILEDQLKLSARDTHFDRFGTEPNFVTPANFDFFNLKCPVHLYNDYYNYYSSYRLQSIKHDYLPNMNEMRDDNLNIPTFNNLELFNDNLLWYGRDPARPLEGRTDPKEYMNRYLKGQIFGFNSARSKRARWFNLVEEAVPGYVFLEQWLELTTVRRTGEFEYVMSWLSHEYKTIQNDRNPTTLAYCFNISNIRKTILLRFYLNLYFFVHLILIIQETS